MGSADRLSELRDSMAGCVDCTCHTGRAGALGVFGTGNPHADILIIKDAPSHMETTEGHYATRDIMWLLESYRKCIIGKEWTIQRCSDQFFSEVFVTSSVICKPIITQGDHKGDPRKPKEKEIKACSSRMRETIYLVDPKIIICFGLAALQSVYGKKKGHTQSGGEDSMLHITVPGKLINVTYPILLCPTWERAEQVGDYEYSEGVVHSVWRALCTAWQHVERIQKEDHV